MSLERYPLSWPEGWKRTRSSVRKRAKFRTGTMSVSVASGLRRLRDELRRLGVLEQHILISTDIPTRLDGLPYSTAREPDDPGVAVYFNFCGKDQVLACDTWLRVADNIVAIAQHIDALRRIERYGVGTIEQAFAGYTGLPAKGQTWRASLGFGPDDLVTRELVDEHFRDRARDSHPDQGGSHDAMASLSAARMEAYEALRG